MNQSNSNDQLVIRYTQCHAEGGTGKERSITLKDGNGKIIKEWKFADATGSNTGMVIPVKELLQLSKDHGNEPLSFFYNAQGHSEGRALASFQVGEKTTASLRRPHPSDHWRPSPPDRRHPSVLGAGPASTIGVTAS